MHKMRKFIMGAVAIVALAVPAASIANVAVTNGVGTVDKGDVQSLLHMNDSQLQSAATNGGIKFTHTYHFTSDESWTCSDGTAMDKPASSTLTYAETATPVLSPQGKVVSWTLSQGSLQSFVFAPPTGAQYAGQCATGGDVTDANLIKYTAGTTDTLYVNGVALPNTPVTP
jgi:hypothetical protein